MNKIFKVTALGILTAMWLVAAYGSSKPKENMRGGAGGHSPAMRPSRFRSLMRNLRRG